MRWCRTLVARPVIRSSAGPLPRRVGPRGPLGPVGGPFQVSRHAMVRSACMPSRGLVRNPCGTHRSVRRAVGSELSGDPAREVPSEGCEPVTRASGVWLLASGVRCLSSRFRRRWWAQAMGAGGRTVASVSGFRDPSLFVVRINVHTSLCGEGKCTAASRRDKSIRERTASAHRGIAEKSDTCAR